MPRGRGRPTFEAECPTCKAVTKMYVVEDEWFLRAHRRKGTDEWCDNHKPDPRDTT